MGLYDKHIPETIGDFCKKTADMLLPLKEKENRFSYVFETIYYLAQLLEMKADIGNRIRALYKAGDREGLKNISDSIPELINRLDKFHKTFRKNWLVENRVFGFEIQDIRIGAVRARLCYVKDVIESYLSGDISEIQELCIEPLYIDCRTEDSKEPLNTTLPLWHTIVSPNVI